MLLEIVRSKLPTNINKNEVDIMLFDRTKITSDIIDYIKTFPNLKFLDVQGCHKLHLQGLVDLILENPNLVIYLARFFGASWISRIHKLLPDANLLETRFLFIRNCNYTSTDFSYYPRLVRDHILTPNWYSRQKELFNSEYMQQRSRYYKQKQKQEWHAFLQKIIDASPEALGTYTPDSLDRMITDVESFLRGYQGF